MKIAIKAAAILLVSVCAAPAAMAQEAAADEGGPIAVIRTTDTAMTCAAMADEAAQLSESMGGEPGDSLFGRLGGVARAGAAMMIPGAGLVMAGTDALTAPGREREAAEEEAIQHRWYYLNGLYAGRDCMNIADAAGPAPASPADAAPAVAPGS